ncbi:MAG: hypothetical protein ACYTAU_01225, partial [Planctomycetota bacterium]
MSTRFDHALVMCFVTTLSGCAQPQGPPSVTAAEPDDVQEALAVSPQTAAVADQARRDVEQLRGLDQDRTPATGGGPDTAARRPDVEWILPAPQRRAAAELAGGNVEAAEAPAGDPADDPAGGQAALGRDRPSGAAGPREEPGGGSTIPAPESEETDRLRRLIVELSSELYRRGAYSDMPLRELLLIAATTLVTPDRAL